MPRSVAYARIKANVLRITRAIPYGQISSFQAIGTHLAVMPRHVAYILATLTPIEQASTPWHRVISHTGQLDREKYDDAGQSQHKLLLAEGVQFTADRQVSDFATIFFPITAQTTGVPAGIQSDS